jgi:hypothetical protein
MLKTVLFVLFLVLAANASVPKGHDPIPGCFPCKAR